MPLRPLSLDSDGEQLVHAKELLMRARRNIAQCLEQISWGLFILLLIAAADHPAVGRAIDALPNYGSTRITSNALWIAKWSFVVGTVLYILLLAVYRTVSFLHSREARELVLYPEEAQ